MLQMDAISYILQLLTENISFSVLVLEGEFWVL